MTGTQKYRGYKIEQDEDGYFCDALGLGYADTADEIRVEIDVEMADMRTDENVYGLASVAQSIAEDRG